MTPNDLVEALRSIPSYNQTELSALAKRVVRESRALPRAAAAHWNDPNTNVATNAVSVLIDMEDLAAIPLLEVPDSVEPYDPVSKLGVVVDAQVELRKTTVSRLMEMLQDKRPLNYAKRPRVEETPPKSRVCDEAYVLLRRLLNTAEDQSFQLRNARLFMRLPEERKDIEIRKAQNSKPWSDFTSGSE
jgi:hypothetical protein